MKIEYADYRKTLSSKHCDKSNVTFNKSQPQQNWQADSIVSATWEKKAVDSTVNCMTKNTEWQIECKFGV